MPVLDLVIGPDPVFRQKALPVKVIDDEIRELCDNMLETLYAERGIGIGANMVGILKRVIVVDLQEEGVRKPLICINPKIIKASKEMEAREEASLCFPGIRAEIKRPNTITLSYQDQSGEKHTLEASDWLATVIQHEIEYLDGRTFLDNLSKMKRDRLLKKMHKQLKHNHDCDDPHCSHEH
ncbi:peptide deformylase [Kordiimonas aquimaris]|uniref:peptide deformylase n=1 Tax=Kordiimonas aquimaris TaxID=707591 RepID=UPI0021D36D79|nr:peptide deformylase [Kordiimonas aquimaris]